MAVKPEYLTLDALFKNALFRIPGYQRAYSWESRQRKDLFDDIRKLYRLPKDRHHFMSTVVCLQTSELEEIGTDEYRVLEIVDGQQRITTLVILLKELAKSLAEGSPEEQAEANKVESLLVKTKKTLILLQTNHDSSFIFREYLLYGKCPEETKIRTLAEANLRQAFLDCHGFVDEWRVSGASLLELLKMLKNRLDFIFYVLEDEASVYTVFEVLNSRGLAVDPLDKCKSTLMGLAFEKLEKVQAQDSISELHKYWSRIYAIIGIRDLPGDEILRFAATLKHPDPQSKTLSASASIEFLQQFCSAHPEQILDMSQWLLDVTKALHHLHGDVRKKAVTEISQARLLATSIILSKLDQSEKEYVLEQWERVTFRIYGMFRRDSRTKVGDYIRLSRDITRLSLSKDEVLTRLRALGSDYPISQAVSGVRNSDCYNGWEHELRYFLFRYEQSLAIRKGTNLSQETWSKIWAASPSTTIEHIFPQSHSANWAGKFGKDPEQHVNRLGNLVLLPPGTNAKAGTKSFRDKKTLYQNTLLMMNDILPKSDWTKKTAIEREDALLVWAEQEWDDLP